MKKLAVVGFACLFLISLILFPWYSRRSEKAHLVTALHTRPTTLQLFDSGRITNAIQAFGENGEAAFTILKAASNETNMLLNAGRAIDINIFVRAGAIYGMGQLGKSVPEVTPFLWEVIHSPSRKSSDRWMAFAALQKIGFQVKDIPALANLISSPVCDENILTGKVPEAVSELIETNLLAAKPYLPAVENLLDDPDPDTQFRAALALVKSEGGNNPKIFSALHALFQRPNDRTNEYYKSLSLEILGEAGPAAQSLIPCLADFARSDSDPGIQESVQKTIGEIKPASDSLQ
ncbi:MAG: HEAT repeat domain-containing protein [Limisphaerales bacterium]